MANAERPPQTREGRLLKQAMLRHRPAWDAPDLVPHVPFSVDWIRATIRGYRNTGEGTYEAVIPKADTLALLAAALGNITEDQLRGIGRDDAATALSVLRSDLDAGGTVERLTKIRDDIEALLADLREA